MHTVRCVRQPAARMREVCMGVPMGAQAQVESNNVSSVMVVIMPVGTVCGESYA